MYRAPEFSHLCGNFGESIVIIACGFDAQCARILRTWGEQKLENGGPNFWPQKRGQFLGPKLGPYCFFNRDSKKGPNFGPQKRTIMWPPFQGKFLGRGANFLVPFLGPLLAHKDVFPSLTHKRQICGARIWVLAVH